MTGRAPNRRHLTLWSTARETPIVVAVIMGGRSGEHDVSLRSGQAAVQQLQAASTQDAPHRFEPFPVVIDREGGWHFPEPTDRPARPLWSVPSDRGLPLPEGLRSLLDQDPDVVFVAMHGPEGEDGKIQSLLELVDLRYTGSDPYASSLAMDKPRAKRILASHGLLVPEELLLTRAEWGRDRESCLHALRTRIGAPWVLKTPRLGSSVGLDIVHAPDRLETTIDELFSLDESVMAERFVRGRELTCAILDGPAFGPIRALPLIEITPVGDPFFNYHAKYTPGAAREICPAPVPSELSERAQSEALLAHGALGCRGFSRTDFIWSDGDELFVLETNTIPGLTETSLLPQAAAAAGIPFTDLVAGMVLSALTKP